MAFNEEDADVFAIPDFWGSSSWMSQRPEEPTTFFSLDATGTSSLGAPWVLIGDSNM